jgi:hypothetical protein
MLRPCAVGVKGSCAGPSVPDVQSAARSAVRYAITMSPSIVR